VAVFYECAGDSRNTGWHRCWTGAWMCVQSVLLYHAVLPVTMLCGWLFGQFVDKLLRQTDRLRASTLINWPASQPASHSVSPQVTKYFNPSVGSFLANFEVCSSSTVSLHNILNFWSTKFNWIILRFRSYLTVNTLYRHVHYRNKRLHVVKGSHRAYCGKQTENTV
jgi:hypothetical protein